MYRVCYSNSWKNHPTSFSLRKIDIWYTGCTRIFSLVLKIESPLVIHISSVQWSHCGCWVSGHGTVSPRGNTGLGTHGLWSQHFHQPINIQPCLCAFFFKDAIFNVSCWSMNTESIANSTTVRAYGGLSNTRMFSVRRIRAFSCLRTIVLQHPGWESF